MLVNMGGPESREELKIFLARMFRDPFILPFGKLGRNILAWVISTTRYKKSWKKYELIGGTPLVRATRETAASLQKVLGETYEVKHAFSYSMPDVEECLKEFKNQLIREIAVVPLYPQASFTTTSSVMAEVDKMTRADSFYEVRVLGEFYARPEFVSFWVHLIKEHLIKNEVVNPTLFFSAHSIPEYHVLNGDTYAASIVNSAALIATELGLHFESAFQSGMRRGKWIGPDAKQQLKLLREEGIDNLVIIPISFVHENLETRFDIDLEIVPYALNTLGFTQVSRVCLPDSDPRLVAMLAGMVKGENEK